MTLNPDATIYEGFWVDWSGGRIWGLTWTLHPTKAVIFTNCMALFVTLFGAQLWTIVRYVLHRSSAPVPTEMTTPHLNKQQVILRNASSGISTAGLMLKLAWKSRRSTGKRSKRSWSIGLLAIFYAILIMGVELFSSKAIGTKNINGGSAVLATNKDCGIWNQTYYNMVDAGTYSNEEEFGLFVLHAEKLASEVQLSYEYGQECYLSSPSSKQKSSTCTTMKKAKLPYERRDEVSCPFEQHMCQSGAAPFALDTGFIDSHDDLGINSDPPDRLKYRRITTCAIVNGTGRITGWDGQIMNSSSPRPSPDTAFAHFGPSIYKNTEYTYSLSNFASFYDNFTVQVTNHYQLDVERAMASAEPAWSVSDFDPIPDLSSGGDLSLFFLSFAGMYLGAIDDPWFSAHEEIVFNTSRAFLQRRYSRDAAISTLGCTEQHQFCTNNGSCTGFLGFDQVQNELDFNSGLSPRQNATFDRMLRAVTASTLRNVVEYLALTTTPLLASRYIATGSSGAIVSRALPADQWKTEIEYWHSVALAHFQRTIVQWATGQIAPQPQLLLPPTSEQDKWFCDSLIIPSAIYQSFSVMAIIIIFIVGLFIIIASLNMIKLATLFRRCLKRNGRKRTWNDDEMLGLGSPDGNSSEPKPSKKVSDLDSKSEERTSEFFEWEKLPTQTRFHGELDPQRSSQMSQKPPASPKVSSFLYRRQDPPPRPLRDSQTSLNLKGSGFALPSAPASVLGMKAEKRQSRFWFDVTRPAKATRPGDHQSPETNWI